MHHRVTQLPIPTTQTHERIYALSRTCSGMGFGS